MALIMLAGLGGACTSQVAEFGEPTDMPPRPAAQPAYPSVHDMPAARNTRPLTAEERQKIADDLFAARERQEAETAEPAPARKPMAR